MMLTSARVCVALAALASCQRGQPQTTTDSSPVEKVDVKTTGGPVVDVAPRAHEVVSQRNTEAFPECPGARAFSLELNGLSQEQVSERFGPPSKKEAYRAGDRGGEFYAGLKNVYPSKVPGNRDVPIEEWTWASGDCLLTVWFHRVNGAWTSLDDVYRNKDVAF